jgi:radical SAM/Cys-rich protein
MHDSFGSGRDGSGSSAHSYERALADLARVRRGVVETLQVNLGLKCNQACAHCHHAAGPDRIESLDARTADRILDLIARDRSVRTVDLTGGAPELHPLFRRIVDALTVFGRSVIVRSNLTVLLLPEQEGTIDFLAARKARIIASLPCYIPENVDAQRGRGAYARSVSALRRLNAVGYGRTNGDLSLDLVYNPGGPALAPEQSALERDYKRELMKRWGISFDRLLAMNNVPLARYKEDLSASGGYDVYLGFLAHSYNPRALPALMCRSQVSVRWDGRLFDCDFNLAADAPLGGLKLTVWDLQSFQEAPSRIAIAAHCLACAAGRGSSCGGALT